jgi:cytochrome P450
VGAGHDTSSSTLAWIVKFLADNCASQIKLRRQLQIAYKEAHQTRRQPTVTEVLKPAPYLEAFIEECLRMNPTVPVMIREAIVDTTILGHFIPKGTTLLCYTHGPGGQMNNTSFEAPESERSNTSQTSKDRVGEWHSSDISLFKPERWLRYNTALQNEHGDEFDGLEYDANAGPFLTFGAGPRSCFGKKLAYMELRVVLVLLVWNFDFEPCPAELSTGECNDGATVSPKHCYVRLKEL